MGSKRPTPPPRAVAPLSERHHAVALAGAFATLYAAFVLVPAGRRFDHSIMVTAQGIRALAPHATTLLGVVTPVSVAAACVALAVRPLLRLRRWTSRGVRGGAAVLASAVSAEALKLWLPHSTDSGYQLAVSGGGGFPSGHATLSMAFALAWPTVLVPRWAQRLEVPLLTWALLMAGATVCAGWHRPGEAAAGLVLACFWHRVLGCDQDHDGSSGSRGRPPAEVLPVLVRRRVTPAVATWETGTRLRLRTASPCSA